MRLPACRAGHLLKPRNVLSTSVGQSVLHCHPCDRFQCNNCHPHNDVHGKTEDPLWGGISSMVDSVAKDIAEVEIHLGTLADRATSEISQMANDIESFVANIIQSKTPQADPKKDVAKGGSPQSHKPNKGLKT